LHELHCATIKAHKNHLEIAKCKISSFACAAAAGRQDLTPIFFFLQVSQKVCGFIGFY